MNNTSRQLEERVTLSFYVVGFVLSLVLTVAAYLVVVGTHLSLWTVTLIVIGLALIQVIAQLHYFLHLTQESKPRWNRVVFGLMVSTLAIIVVGTLWIMYSLNERTMLDSAEMDAYMLHESGVPVLQ